MQDIKTAIIQTSLLWEDITGNLAMFDKKISNIKEEVDIIVLPEMFNTAFSMNAAAIAELPEGRTMQWIRQKAKEKNCVVVGSILVNENQKYFNR